MCHSLEPILYDEAIEPGFKPRQHVEVLVIYSEAETEGGRIR